MIYLSTKQLIICIAIPILVIILLLLITIPLAFLYQKKCFKKYVYHKIKGIVQNNDYYLINDFTFKINDVATTSIDHIIFANKYIYICKDIYYEGNIMGKDDDSSLVMYGRNNEKYYVDNPYQSMNKLLRQLSTSTGVPTEYMIGLTIINNNCISKVNSNSKQFFLLRRNKVNKVIKVIESRDIGTLDERQLQSTVNAFAKVNLRDRINKKMVD